MTYIPREEQNSYWKKYAERHLVDKTIAHVRNMTEDEASGIGWLTTRPLVLIMEDGSYVFPSKDDEGNDGGFFFGKFKVGELVGKKITSVGYMTEEEARNVGYDFRPLIMFLDEEEWIFPCSNKTNIDGGALFGASESGEELTFPVLR